MIQYTCGIEFGWWKDHQPIVKIEKRNAGGFSILQFAIRRFSISFWVWS